MRPMLASKIKDTSKIKYPVFASAKYDGIRCVAVHGVALSRSLKPIPNQSIQEMFMDYGLGGLDGELIVGDATADDVYRVTNSAVMSRDGEPDFSYHIFDNFYIDAPFEMRLKWLTSEHPRIIMVPQMLVEREDDLLELEKHLLQQGFEGVMVRSPKGLYKHGRSTLKEGYLLKLKRFTDGEAEIVGMEELMHNANEAKTNGLGYTERSNHKANQIPMGTLGALIVKDLKTGISFKIGTGFDEADRQHMWDREPQFKGQIVKYKSFKVGVKDKPRHPVFLGMRNRSDL